MTPTTTRRVKMCGLTTPEQVAWAAEAGAAYVGLNFFPPSPRSITPEAAQKIAAAAPAGLQTVALVVDPDDALIDTLAQLPINMLQFHGAESPARIAELKARTGLAVIKSIGVRTARDLDTISMFAEIVDQVLIDAKPPEGAVLPGGNGLTFDWELLAGVEFPVPWMLAGGLTAANVAEAIRRTGTTQPDVASGIETAPGVKDRAKMHAFMEAVRAA